MMTIGNRQVNLAMPNASPILDRLRSFTQVRGLVFGNYGEASPDVHALVELAARGIAAKRWRRDGARSEAEARSYWVGTCRRRIGVAVARAMARHRIRRTVFIGVPRAVLDDRVRRGVAAARAGVGGHTDADLFGFWAFQTHVQPHAD